MSTTRLGIEVSVMFSDARLQCENGVKLRQFWLQRSHEHLDGKVHDLYNKSNLELGGGARRWNCERMLAGRAPAC